MGTVYEAAGGLDGLPAAEFKITAVGEKGSTTADGRSRPLRRRADIVVHLAPV